MKNTFVKNILFFILFSVSSACGSLSDTSCTPLSESDRLQIQQFLFLADSCIEKEDYINAFELYLNGLMLSQEHECDSITSHIYLKLAKLYVRYFDFISANEYFKKSLDIFIKNKDTVQSVRVINEYIPSLCLEGRFEEAENLYNVINNYNSTDTLFNYYKIFNKAHLLYNKYPDNAVKYFKKAAMYAADNNMPPAYVCAALDGIIDDYLYSEKWDSAMNYLLYKEKYIKFQNRDYMLLKTYKIIADIYVKMNMMQNADNYNIMYNTLLDSVMRFMDYNKLKSNHFIYETKQNLFQLKEITAKVKLKDNRINKQRKITIILTTISLIIISFLIYFLYKRRRKKRNNTRNFILDEKSKTQLLENINKLMDDPNIFCNMNFNLEKLSKMVNSNTNYVSAVINNTYNYNFRTFLNNHRIKEAQKRLKDPVWKKYTINAIAESLGYKSPNTFITLFKKITGITPSAFQNKQDNN